MPENVSDEAFARAVQQLGMARFDDLEAARAVVAENAQKGVVVALADVLIQQGVITAKQRETVEQKVQVQQAGGLMTLGPYKLLKKLGEGGMGTVYLADDLNVGRKVAVKVLPKKHAEDHEFLTRFRREAQATGKLNHVNIVMAYTVDEHMGQHYYAMEYCDGEPLDKILKRERLIPWDTALGIVLQVTRGLKHAHEHGIIHRDIKPANIFICAPLVPHSAGLREDAQQFGKLLNEGFVAKILDLGLSKTVGKDSSFYTQTGIALGTPHYISPEQAKGEKTIDGRTDIYSLGATLYHLVTGMTPFEGSTAAIVMLKHINEELTNPQDVNEDIPDGIVHIIMRMMAKDPNDRYANCQELLDDLELVLEGKMPSSQALDVGKSSVAVARFAKSRPDLPSRDVPSRDRKGAVKPLAHARGSEPPRGTRQQQPVAQPGRLRHERTAGQASSGTPAAKKMQTAMLAVGAGAVLLLVGILVALGRGSQPEAESEDRSSKLEGNSKVETEKRPGTGLAGQQAPSKPVAPTTTAQAPKVTQPPAVVAKPPEPAKTEAKTSPQAAVVAVQPQTTNLKPEPAVDDPECWKNAIDLLALVDPKHDAGKGTWTRADGGVVSDDGRAVFVEMPYRPPGEYDIRVDFTRTRGAHTVVLLLSYEGRRFCLYLGAWNNTIFGFDSVGGRWADGNPTTVRQQSCLDDGRRYTCVVEVRQDRIRASLDGKTITEWRKQYGPVDKYDFFRDPTTLGVGSDASPTIFYHIQVREVSGKGAFTRPNDPAAKEAKKKQDEVWAKRTGSQQPAEAARGTQPETRTPKPETRELAQRVFGALAKPDVFVGAKIEQAAKLLKDANQAGAEPLAALLERAGAAHAKALQNLAAKPPKEPVLIEKMKLTGAIARIAGGKAYLKSQGMEVAVDVALLPPGVFLKALGDDATLADRAAYFVALGDSDTAANILKRLPPDKRPPWADLFDHRAAAGAQPETSAAQSAIRNPKSEISLDLGGVKMDFVLVPAGEFKMGSNDGRQQDRPVHPVKISKPFWLGRCEVTQAQYEKVIGGNPSKSKGPDLPVARVSWEDAQAFCKAASKLTARVMRLPTEAEWEYACRAGTTTSFSAGDKESDLEQVAWFNRNSGGNQHAVAKKRPNAWGLCDMHGNVWEWVQDWFGDRYYSESPASDPKGPDTGNDRALRGGDLYSNTDGCLSAHRDSSSPDRQDDSIGFRVALDP